MVDATIAFSRTIQEAVVEAAQVLMLDSLAVSISVGPGAARTAMGHQRLRGPWGRPQRLPETGPPMPQWATAAAAVGPGAVRRESQSNR